MKFRRLIYLWYIIAVFFVFNAHAGNPVWTFTPLTPTTISVAANSTATIQYIVTNKSKRTHTFMMQAIAGIIQNVSAGNCNSIFTLEYNQSCTLTLNVIGHMMTGNIKNGPIVCQQGNNLQCYQPNAADSLNITLTKASIINITISPTAVPIALVNTPGYSQQLTAIGGLSPYTYTLSSGGLPAGLSLDSNGLISGTATDSQGTFHFTVTASDDNGDNGSQNYTMTLATQFCMAADENLGSWSYDNVSGTWLQIGVSTLPNGINYISCPSTEFCVGMDNNNAYVYNGITWSSATPLTTGFNILTSISCPTTSFCKASDNDGNAYSYNGESWSSATLADTFGASAGLDCSSPSFCMIFDDIVSDPPGTGSNYAVFNGTSWGITQQVSNDGSMPNIGALSCVSSSFCIAGNISPTIGIRQYNGTSWGNVISLTGASNIVGTSCANSSFCMAVDQSNLAYTLSNGTWNPNPVAAPFPDAGQIFGVSCPSSTFCMVVGQNSTSTNAESAASINGGSTWNTVTINNPNNSLFNVSCLASP